MLNIIILIVILIGLTLHRYLTIFYEQGRLPYQMGFLVFATSFIILYFVNFIWMFGIIIGVILALLTLFQLVYSTLLWPFLIPSLVSIYKKDELPLVNSVAYAIWSIVLPVLALLTIFNFFISDYLALWNTIFPIINENYSLTIIIFIVVILSGNIIRRYYMRWLLSN